MKLWNAIVLEIEMNGFYINLSSAHLGMPEVSIFDLVRFVLDSIV